MKQKSDMKYHIAKRYENGKVNTRVAECGKRTHIRHTVAALKTASFKELYKSDKKQCCVNCASKAKEKGRL